MHDSVTYFNLFTRQQLQNHLCSPKLEIPQASEEIYGISGENVRTEIKQEIYITNNRQHCKQIRYSDTKKHFIWYYRETNPLKNDIKHEHKLTLMFKVLETTRGGEICSYLKAKGKKVK